jgi:GNAT superfamily N-acetyltransferase
MEGVLKAAVRALRSLSRPSAAANARRLRTRGETVGSLSIREATPDDIRALAALHVATWNDTHGWRPNGPTEQLRERQWRAAFDDRSDGWFAFVVTRPNGDLVGFATGRRNTGSLVEFGGELNKIYLLREYQRLGIGRRLMGCIARRFLQRKTTSMVLFGEAGNPSCRAWEALGGRRLYSPRGEFHGGYGWHDLEQLASM